MVKSVTKLFAGYEDFITRLHVIEHIEGCVFMYKYVLMNSEEIKIKDISG